MSRARSGAAAPGTSASPGAPPPAPGGVASLPAPSLPALSLPEPSPARGTPYSAFREALAAAGLSAGEGGRALAALERQLLLVWRRRDLAEALMTGTASYVASASASASLGLEQGGGGPSPAGDCSERRLRALPVHAVFREMGRCGLPAGALGEAVAGLGGAGSEAAGRSPAGRALSGEADSAASVCSAPGPTPEGAPRPPLRTSPGPAPGS